MIRRLLATISAAMLASTILASALAVPAAASSGGVPEISAGTFHTCGLTGTGGVKCWGAGGDGALGNGSNADSNIPVDVVGLSRMSGIYAGWYHTCARTETNGLKCWGDNSGGQLGDGTRTTSNVPVSVTDLSVGVIDVAAGGFHTCALTNLGAVLCWGNNDYGQLGDGTTTDHLTPLEVPALTSGVASITAGYLHTCAVLVAGGVKCWGSNSEGQLGDGSTTDRATPFSVAGLADVQAIAAGEAHTCALTGGSVRCWGDNGYGELGDGTFTTSSAPVDVADLSGGAVAISSHGIHTCALTTAGGVKCWGDNIAGQLGDGTTGSDGTPVDVTGLSTGIESVAAGYYHSCAIATNGQPKCWGRNNNGQLGDDTITERHAPVNVPGSFGPRSIAPHFASVVEGDTGTTPLDILVSLSAPSAIVVTVDYTTVDATATAGEDYTAASGTVTFAPGDVDKTISIDVLGDYDPEGREDFDIEFSNPVHASLPGPAVIATITDNDQVPTELNRFASGSTHTCGVTETGGVKCWGDNSTGQLGIGAGPWAGHALDVVNLSGPVASVSGGATHSCAITVGGTLQCWGSNAYGQLGIGPSPSLTSEPVTVAGLSSVGVASVATGGKHTCAVQSNGFVACWGDGVKGQLGVAVSRYDYPLETGIGGMSRVVAGIEHTCGLTTHGGVLCWGLNSQGQLGNGTQVGGPTPVPVTGLSSGVVALSAGALHTCALLANGTIECWGDNEFGQLGDGSLAAFRTTPVVVGALQTDSNAVSAGQGHTCAVDVDGAVWCWGSNAVGELGSPAGAISPDPQPVAGITSGAVDVAVGWAHSCALMANDLIKCWGMGALGQLGDCPSDISSCLYSRPTPGDVLGWVADLAIDDVSVAEGNLGGSSATFTVTLTKPSDRQITVHYETADGSASAGSDYTATSGTLTFAPGETTKSIAVQILGDGVLEPEEDFKVVLSSPSNAPIARSAGIGMITNDDSAATISIDDVGVTEGNTGVRHADFTVSLSQPSGSTITVEYQTFDADAVGGSDFGAASGIVTFLPGETNRPIVIDVYGDTAVEADERFVIDLSNPVGASLADETGEGTIVNDDVPSLSIGDGSATEGDAGTTPMTFTISLSTPIATPVTVNYATANGTATGADYSATSGTATVPAGATTVPVTVPIQGDLLDEANETFTVALSSPSNATIGDGSAVGTIVDDDPKPVITSVNPGSLPQADTVTIRGSGFTGATAVAFARAGGGTIPATTFHVVNDTRLTAVVPPLAATGRVSISTPNGTGMSPADVLIEPRILSFTPAAGAAGTLVTITGSGFTGATAVRFGMTPAGSFAVLTDFQIVATVPLGARTSKIQVITPSGSDTTMGKFTVP